MPPPFFEEAAASPSKSFRLGALAFLLGLAFAPYPPAIVVGAAAIMAAAARCVPARRLLAVVLALILAGAARPGLHATFEAPRLERSRAALSRAVERVMPGPEGALILGITVGETGGMPRWMTLRFRRTGTAHLLAVSGANVAIAAGALIALLFLVGLPRRAVAAIAALAIVAFAAFTGAEPPVVRASLMALLVLAAREAGRRPDKANLLLAAASVMLAADPAARHGVSFALSFAATGGLLWLAPPFGARLEALPLIRRAPEVLRRAAADGLAAQLATLPIAVGTFGTFSTVGLAANILAAPFVPLLTLSGGVLLPLAVFAPAAAPLVALPLVWCSRVLLFLLAWCAAIPGAMLSGGGFPAAAAVAWYLVLAWLVRLPAGRRGRQGGADALSARAKARIFGATFSS